MMEGEDGPHTPPQDSPLPTEFFLILTYSAFLLITFPDFGKKSSLKIIGRKGSLRKYFNSTNLLSLKKLKRARKGALPSKLGFVFAFIINQPT